MPCQPPAGGKLERLVSYSYTVYWPFGPPGRLAVALVWLLGRSAVSTVLAALHVLPMRISPGSCPDLAWIPQNGLHAAHKTDALPSAPHPAPGGWPNPSMFSTAPPSLANHRIQPAQATPLIERYRPAIRLSRLQIYLFRRISRPPAQIRTALHRFPLSPCSAFH